VSPAQLLFLIGYRGTGKTATARLLAEKMGWRWLDADALLEERDGRSIRDIFAAEGEKFFRDRESAILQELAGLDQYVVATGGGIILRSENRERLKQGTVVWLQATSDVLWQRLQADAATAQRRPNLAQGGLAEIEELLHVRTPLYEACQDFTVDTSRLAADEVAQRICDWFRAASVEA